MHPAFVAHLNIHDTAQTSDDPPELVSSSDSESDSDPATHQHSSRATSPVMSLTGTLIRSWILDTDAIASVSSDPTLLSHVQDLPYPIEIRMASSGGEPITCFKEGRAYLIAKDGSLIILNNFATSPTQLHLQRHEYQRLYRSMPWPGAGLLRQGSHVHDQQDRARTQATSAGMPHETQPLHDQRLQTGQVPQSPVYVMMVTNPSTPDPQAEEPILLSQPHSSVPNQSDSPRAALAQLRAQLRTVYDRYDGPPDGKCWPEGLLDPADYVDLNEWVSTATVSSSETENLFMTVMNLMSPASGLPTALVTLSPSLL
eukprot:gene4900-34666_t